MTSNKKQKSQLVSSDKVSTLGANLTLIERHLMVGDCMVTGCVLSKILIKLVECLDKSFLLGVTSQLWDNGWEGIPYI